MASNLSCDVVVAAAPVAVGLTLPSLAQDVGGPDKAGVEKAFARPV